MKIVSWNIRGLGDVRKRGIINDVMKKIKPDIFMIQETKREMFGKKEVGGIFGSIFKGWIFAPSLGKSGGSAMIWNRKTVEVVD